ncbi:MAG TPA: EAL domain-containing protein [Solirubrobacteraceae bacterium]|jgi:EAL domain-containing protein (putative c-di-GMP-specific phosphodiesterase class I)|nr:EAL domain-containing protein [Solirubrobacteraceae bacterium]
MLSCTLADATPRVLLAPAPGRRGELARLRSGRHARCSPAGVARRAWLGRLRRALREQRFVLHYQPIVSLRDGRVSHHEALVRLADEPGGGLLAPGAFLPAAERFGLICDIDRLVLERVIALLGSAGGESDARIAVNVSALSVSDGRLLGFIERCLARHRVRPSRLVLELTETASISDMAQAKAFCAGAQALGCAVALDDFGAGFGAFHYLKHLAFSYLKIDGDFISGLPGSAHDQLVVRALVGLARGMGFATIAEFVHDQQTLRLLERLGVDYAQGFHVGRPRALAPV